MVDKGRLLSESLAKALDHFGLNDKAITKLIPLFHRSDFNPLATTTASQFYASLMKDGRSPTEALQLLVDGDLVACGNFVQLVSESWTKDSLTKLLRGRDVSAVVALTTAINQLTATNAVIGELLARDDVFGDLSRFS
jgi:hypothetical protein